jgi:hypothetical protein
MSNPVSQMDKTDMEGSGDGGVEEIRALQHSIQHGFHALLRGSAAACYQDFGMIWPNNQARGLIQRSYCQSLCDLTEILEYLEESRLSKVYVICGERSYKLGLCMSIHNGYITMV